MPRYGITGLSLRVSNALKNGELYVTPSGRVAKVFPKSNNFPLSVLRRVYIPNEAPEEGLNLIDAYAHTAENIRQCKDMLKLIFDRCLSSTKRLISIIGPQNQNDISYSFLAKDSTNLTQLDIELEQSLKSSQACSVIPFGSRSEIVQKWLGFFCDCKKGGEYTLPTIDMRFDLIPKDCRRNFIESTVNQVIIDMRVDTAKNIFGFEVYTDKELVQEYQRVLGLLRKYSSISCLESAASDVGEYERAFVDEHKQYHLDELLFRYARILNVMKDRKLLEA